MKNDTIVMTLDFGKDHFNAIVLDNKLKLISTRGDMITVPTDDPSVLSKQSGESFKQLIKFFKH